MTLTDARDLFAGVFPGRIGVGVNVEEMTNFVQHASQLSEFEKKPSECSIASRRYFEQLLAGASILRVLLGGKSPEIVFGDKTSGDLTSLWHEPVIY